MNIWIFFFSVKDRRIMWWLSVQTLSPLLIRADAAHTEEEEWSDEFDEDTDEATLGLIPFVMWITNHKEQTLNLKLVLRAFTTFSNCKEPCFTFLLWLISLHRGNCPSGRCEWGATCSWDRGGPVWKRLRAHSESEKLLLLLLRSVWFAKVHRIILLLYFSTTKTLPTQRFNHF